MTSQLYDKNVSGVLSATDSFYNLIIKNNNTGYDTNGNPIPVPTAVPVNFNENRTVPYLYNPKDHFVSMLALQLDTATLPVFICEPVVGDTNVDNTIYIFTVTNSANDAFFHLRIQWKPDDLVVPKPVGPVPDDYTKNPYYFSYSYQHFLSLFNTQLAEAWNANETLNIYPPPFLLFENGSITLYGGTHMQTIFDGSGSFKLFFNTELYLLVSGLPAVKQAETPTTLNRNYQLLFTYSPSGLNTVTLYTDVEQTTSYTAIKSVSEYVPLSYWNPIDSIIFTSNYINVVPELVTANSPYGLTGARQVSNAEQYYILFDYMAPTYGASDYHPNINYEPIAEYRLSDMYGNGNITQLEIRTLWKDKWGVLHTFTLESGSSAAIKLLFRKKSFYE